MASDERLREQLLDIDNDEDTDVSRFEADFIESICFIYKGPLSAKQRATAQNIIDRYRK